MFNHGLTNEMKLKVLTIMLDKIQQGTVDQKGWGLCNNIGEVMAETYPEQSFLSGNKLVEELGADWPLHTGQRDYPVPAPKEVNMSASDSYITFNDKYTGAYGELRISFLNFMIGRITERINNINAINGDT